MRFKKLYGQEWDILQGLNMRGRSAQAIAKLPIDCYLLILIAEDLQGEIVKIAAVGGEDAMY